MSTTRRPLGTGPRTVADEQSRTDERGTAAERAPAPGSPLPPPTPSPFRSGRRPLGTGPDATADR
ncbi:hypothetical protein [Streptomyces sp. BPTC-684]|uniref:hypothetical protein n=1 Tax=Streptomyces sp. BPTC-684 TaxID=3043734 RepID=UPI0024B09054|nr:hypothetical protein [Streptomyces sp. BPTC-684]WHM40760.1 hypothetical protein QIY60_30395 [Streptomyces sp. BPTC-684]